MSPLIQMTFGSFMVAGVLLLAAKVMRESVRPQPKDEPKPKPRMPLSERGCLAVLRLAAWLERVGAAWDAAIVRYRMERMLTYIEMESSREREARRAA